MAFRHMLLDILQWMGLVLLHFLWQGLLVGAAYAAVRVLLPRGTARYRLGVAALMALSLCPVLTAWRLRAPAMVPSGSVLQPVVVAAGGPDETASVLAHLTGPFGIALWVAVIWVAGVLVLSLRVWRQWHALRSLVAAGLDDDGPVRHMLLRLARRFRMRRPVSLVWSASVGSPLLVGWFKPVIVMPLAMVSGFPRSQLELVLAHELAHLTRMDPLVNFFQVALETLLFFHPAVHWISADVRNEREICCDQMALAVHGGNWRDLARALSTLGDLQRAGPMVLAASGGVLLDRVHQMAAGDGIVAAPAPRPYSGALLALGMLATLVLGLVLKREDVPDLMGPIPRMASLIALPLAQSLQHAWHPADLQPSNAPLQRPISMLVDTPGASMPPLPLVEGALATPRALPSLTIANLAPRNEVMLSAYPRPRVGAPALIPLRIRKPVYPATALEKGIEGKVVIEFALSSDGTVREMQVVSAEPAGVFEQAALASMRGWIYSVPPPTLPQSATDKYSPSTSTAMGVP